jgi:uncharacterized protein YcaQ
MPVKPAELPLAQARALWLHAQRLDVRAPFGVGPAAAQAAIEQLGYVQIDTINVIERCHHHILYTRIPAYRRADLHRLQSVDKTVFEYWTHALAYVPIRDFPIFRRTMLQHRRDPRYWGQTVTPADYRRVIRLIRAGGPITIRDIEDDVLVEKEHLWASRKPSKGALQLAFWNGVVAISERQGMLKTYELMERHFGWDAMPKPASERQGLDYLIDTALRSQAVVNVDSIVHARKYIRPAIRARLDARVRRKELLPVEVEGVPHWTTAAALETLLPAPEPLVHILSPFDPLVIFRKRTKLFFGYDHLFEAYVPKARRKYGYFTLPVLVDDRIEAMLDLKTDRAAGKVLLQSWHWTGRGNRPLRARIEEELHRFEAFQLGD